MYGKHIRKILKTNQNESSEQIASNNETFTVDYFSSNLRSSKMKAMEYYFITDAVSKQHSIEHINLLDDFK